MTAQPALKAISTNAAGLLAPSKLDILRAIHLEKHPQHWTDEWTTESKGRFMVVSHKIRVELASSHPCTGEVYAVRMSYDDLNLHFQKSSRLTDDYKLFFKPPGSSVLSWNISQQEFAAVKQQHAWIRERAGENEP